MKKTEGVEIKEGIYWVGAAYQDEDLNCNPYLLIEGDEGVLFDPGSVLDFEYVYENVINLIPLEKIKYVVLHHQDPDLCSSVPLFEQKGGNFKLVTHWRTKMLVKYYGVRSEYYIVNKNDFQLTLKTGRKLDFVKTPYLHFPGAIATYDAKTKVLFSSDLFGAFSADWSLYAGEDYIGKMKTFHENYMPSNDILRPVMEKLLEMDIDLIAPQHGSIIKSDIAKYIRVLKNLECGALVTPVIKDLAKSGGYMMLSSLVLKRYAEVFGKDEVAEIIGTLNIVIDKETLEIMDYNYIGDNLWNIIFEKIAVEKGLKWLIVLETFVKKLSVQYKVPMPKIFEKIMKESYELTEENKKLQNLNLQLEEDIIKTKKKMARCPVTDLFNFEFFKEYLSSKIIEDNDDQNSALIIINIDNMAKIRFAYGDNEVDEVLKSTVYLINNVKDEDGSVLFRLHGAAFAWYFPDTEKEVVLQRAEQVRNEVSASQSFVENITLSIGVVLFDEIKLKEDYEKDPFEIVYDTAMLRVKLANTRGKNAVCSASDIDDDSESLGKILIVDIDEVNLDVLKTILENLKYEVITAKDGETALAMAKSELPNAIISEIMLPRKDAFMIRESLLMDSSTKDILFIIVSHLKNENSVKRALSLGIENYFKKPIMLSELLGIIKLKIKGGDY